MREIILWMEPGVLLLLCCEAVLRKPNTFISWFQGDQWLGDDDLLIHNFGEKKTYSKIIVTFTFITLVGSFCLFLADEHRRKKYIKIIMKI